MLREQGTCEIPRITCTERTAGVNPAATESTGLPDPTYQDEGDADWQRGLCLDSTAFICTGTSGLIGPDNASQRMGFLPDLSESLLKDLCRLGTGDAVTVIEYKKRHTTNPQASGQSNISLHLIGVC